jgi:hypothetical protein
MSLVSPYVGHDHKAVGDDGILPTAEILSKYAHRGNTFVVMLRCGRGVCGTTRVDVNRATCPSAQGSAWTAVVIWGKLTLFIATAINPNSRAKVRQKIRTAKRFGGKVNVKSKWKRLRRKNATKL